MLFYLVCSIKISYICFNTIFCNKKKKKWIWIEIVKKKKTKNPKFSGSMAEINYRAFIFYRLKSPHKQNLKKEILSFFFIYTGIQNVLYRLSYHEKSIYTLYLSLHIETSFFLS